MYKKDHFVAIGLAEYEMEEAEKAFNEKVQSEMDQMWDEYRAEQQYKYDIIASRLNYQYNIWKARTSYSEEYPTTDVYDDEEEYPTTDVYDDEEEFYGFYEIDMPISKREMRRYATYKHKQHLVKVAHIMDDHYKKMSEEDMHNLFYCKKRGGRRTDDPKSLICKAELFMYHVSKVVPEYDPGFLYKDYLHSDYNHPERVAARNAKIEAKAAKAKAEAESALPEIVTKKSRKAEQIEQVKQLENLLTEDKAV